MSADNSEREAQRIVRDLTDRERLAGHGVSEEWIQSCADLVDEFRRLQQQFRDLESQLAPSENDSGQDTLLL